jgi:hypothetical protein
MPRRKREEPFDPTLFEQCPSTVKGESPRNAAASSRNLRTKDAIRLLKEDIMLAERALASARKRLEFLEALWNDDTLMKARQENARRVQRS